MKIHHKMLKCDAEHLKALGICGNSLFFFKFHTQQTLPKYHRPNGDTPIYKRTESITQVITNKHSPQEKKEKKKHIKVLKCTQEH